MTVYICVCAGVEAFGTNMHKDAVVPTNDTPDTTAIPSLTCPHSWRRKVNMFASRSSLHISLGPIGCSFA